MVIYSLQFEFLIILAAYEFHFLRYYCVIVASSSAAVLVLS